VHAAYICLAYAAAFTTCFLPFFIYLPGWSLYSAGASGGLPAVPSVLVLLLLLLFGAWLAVLLLRFCEYRAILTMLCLPSATGGSHVLLTLTVLLFLQSLEVPLQAVSVLLCGGAWVLLQVC
jgi:hypothetical protein